MISEETLIALEFDRVRKIAADLAASPLGTERLSVLIPFANAGEAKRCLMRTTEMIRVQTSGEFPIHGLSDVREPLMQASVAGSALEPLELLKLADVAETAVEVRAFLLKRKQNLPLLFDMAATVADLHDVAKRITHAIERDGSVRDEASPELKHIRQAIRSETRALEDKINGILHRWSDSGILQDAVVSYREGRFVLPVRDAMRSPRAGRDCRSIRLGRNGVYGAGGNARNVK